MVYPGRPVLETLPQFRGTNTTRPTTEQRTELIQFVAAQYQAGRSFRSCETRATAAHSRRRCAALARDGSFTSEKSGTGVQSRGSADATS